MTLNPVYPADRSELPPLVAGALGLANEFTFVNSCTPETGALLRVLAAGVRGGRIGETGTGTGVGTAWMVGGLEPSTRLHTVELDAGRAQAAADLFVAVPNVEVVSGDWKLLLERGPFDLLFADGGGKREDQELLLKAIAPGGMLVLDDFTPGRSIDEDPLRRYWLEHPGLTATEVRLSESMAVVLAVKR